MKDGFNLKGRIQKDEAGIRYRHSSAIAHIFRNLDFEIWIQDPLPVDQLNKNRMSFKSHVGGGIFVTLPYPHALSQMFVALFPMHQSIYHLITSFGHDESKQPHPLICVRLASIFVDMSANPYI